MTVDNKSFSAGLEGVIACATQLSHVDGTAGRLIYRGHMAVDLATTRSVEEVWYLLQNGRFPTPSELVAFTDRVETFGALTQDEYKLVKRLAGTEPMAGFRTALSALAAHRGYAPWLNRDAAEAYHDAFALACTAPAIVEVLHTRRRPRLKSSNTGYAERYLWGLLDEQPSPQAVAAVNAYMILTMDHGLNASTFSARVTCSTGADAGASLTTAIGTLSGPLHGGAPGPVLDMLDEIGTPEKADAWVAEQLKAKRRIMGFGHRVYKTEDPRAAKLRDVARQLNSPRVDLASKVEQSVLAALQAHQEAKSKAEGKPGRPLRTNVEFWTAVVLEYVGIPRTHFSSTFCASRIMGWSEHIREQMEGNKLYRPLSLYTDPSVTAQPVTAPAVTPAEPAKS